MQPGLPFSGLVSKPVKTLDVAATENEWGLTMERRSFTSALATAVAFGFASRTPAAAVPEEVQAGCEGAVTALKGWLTALTNRDFGYLQQHLASDFTFTTTPLKVPGGKTVAEMKNKAEFIEQDRHVYNSHVRVLRLTARRMNELVVTLVFAQVAEEFRGDLGPGMPSAAEMNAFIQGNKFAYASGWREIDGRWQCTSHHILGELR
jgi:hypothetical protein